MLGVGLDYDLEVLTLDVDSSPRRSRRFLLDHDFLDVWWSGKFNNQTPLETASFEDVFVDKKVVCPQDVKNIKSRQEK